MRSLIFLIGVSLFLINSVSAQSNDTVYNGTVSEYLASNPNLTLLAQFAYNYTEIYSIINNTNVNITLFAPTDAAFQNLPTIPSGQALLDVLYYHILGVTPPTYFFNNGELLSTMLNLVSLGNSSQQLKVSMNNGSVLINNAMVVSGLIQGTNGFVYIIDAVLMPPNNATDVARSLGFNILANLAANAGLDDPAQTIFAPIDSAFTNLPSDVYKYLTSNNSEAAMDLQNILNHHVVASIHYTPNLVVGNNTLTTKNGDDIEVEKFANGSIFVFGASSVTADNIIVSNGVIHAISDVLLPDNFIFYLPKLLIGSDLNRFAEALAILNMTSVFETTTPYTIFAPSDAAFNEWMKKYNNTWPPTSELSSFILYHITSGLVDSQQLTNGELIPTLFMVSTLVQPVKVSVSNNVTMINDATIEKPDLMASNGYIHVLGKVLDPPANMTTIVKGDTSLSSLVEAFDLAEMNSDLEGPNITLFAPTNVAFNNLYNGVRQYLFGHYSESMDKLISLLGFHLSDDVIYTVDIPENTPTLVPTKSGHDLTLLVSTGRENVTIDGRATVSQRDTLASNGAIQIIDTVLIPPGFSISVEEVLELLGATSYLDYMRKTNFSIPNIFSGSYTFLAPTNDAFTKSLETELNDTAKRIQILSYHVLEGLFYSLESGKTYPTILKDTFVRSVGSGIELVVSNKTGSSASINSITRGYPSAVVYDLDKVLSPNKPSKGLKPGIIAAIVIVCVVVVVAVIVLIIWRVRRRGYETV